MKMFLKPLAIAAMSIANADPGAAADTVPAKFRGTWVSAETKNDTPWTISAKTIGFGPGSKCNITSVTPAAEDGKTIIVAWKCPEYPNMLPAEVAWKLTKVNGQEMLLQASTDCPSCLSISRRVK